MKKIMLSILVVFAAFVMISCEMTYDKNYEVLTQWFAPHTGDDGDWIGPSDKSEMTFNTATGLFELEVTTNRKNVGITVCKSASYDGQLHWDNSDAATQSAFNWRNDYCHKQLVIKKAGTYLVTVKDTGDTSTDSWSVTAK